MVKSTITLVNLTMRYFEMKSTEELSIKQRGIDPYQDGSPILFRPPLII